MTLLNARRWALATAFALVNVVAQAQPLAQSESVRRDARARFDRAVQLFNQGNNSTALAEFMRAQELQPHPVILLNIGLVHAVMGNPVAARDAFDRLLAQPHGLTDKHLTLARARRAEQAAAIAELDVTTNVADARIEIDNLPVSWVQGHPLPVAAGEHIIAAFASGYKPERQSVILAGGAQMQAKLDLQPLASELAHLHVQTNLSGSDVLIDDKLVGRTPLPATLALAPGAHRVTARRPGYTAAEHSVSLGPGASGEVALELSVDQAQLPLLGADLAIELREQNARVLVEGKSLPSTAAPVRLPEGSYGLRVEHPGFVPYERRLQLQAGTLTRLSVQLDPTPEWLDNYQASVRTRRVAGIVTLIAGGAVAAAGGGFLFFNQSAKQDAQAGFEQADLNTPGGDCYPSRTGKASTSTAYCEEELRIRLDTLEETRARDVYGWLGLGLGVAAAGTGLIVWLTGDDPHRYERREPEPAIRAVPFALHSGAGIVTFGSF